MVKIGTARRPGRAHRWAAAAFAAAAVFCVASGAAGQEERETRKAPLHGKHWVAITGKPLAATAGALTFARGGNAVDAACAMLAAAATMWDTLSWGGETQALIHDPRSGEVRAINALGVAPTGATRAIHWSASVTTVATWASLDDGRGLAASTMSGMPSASPSAMTAGAAHDVKRDVRPSASV